MTNTLPFPFSQEQIHTMAPDSAAIKAAQSVATPGKWVSTGFDGQAAWGECKGSGAKPYQVGIDFQGPAFKCSCPSRKLPCKHALGLMLLLGQQQLALDERPTTAPVWLTTWLTTRAAKREQASERAANPKPVDEEARAKRIAQREARVAAGVAELSLWLADVSRGGLSRLQALESREWARIAARMVDAQAPGLARQVRDLEALCLDPAPGRGERVADAMGRLHLLLRAHARLAQLPADLATDVRDQLGWTHSQEELLNTPGVEDVWHVIGHRSDVDEKLRVQRVWLYGAARDRYALLLGFNAPGQPAPALPPPGMCFSGELVFYPGRSPQRVAIKSQLELTRSPDSFRPASRPHLEAAQDAFAHALSQSPFVLTVPLCIQHVRMIPSAGQIWVQDADQAAWPLAGPADAHWRALALSGGHPIDIFGEWDGYGLRPLCIWTPERRVQL